MVTRCPESYEESLCMGKHALQSLEWGNAFCQAHE